MYRRALGWKWLRFFGLCFKHSFRQAGKAIRKSLPRRRKPLDPRDMACGEDGAMVEIEDSSISGALTLLRGNGGSLPASSSEASHCAFDVATVRGGLTVLNGSGCDTLTLNSLTLVGGLLASNGEGAAYFSLGGSHVSGSVTVLRGSGGSLPASPAWASDTYMGMGEVHGFVTLINGGGEDRVNMEWHTFQSSVLISSGEDGSQVRFSHAPVGGSLWVFRGNEADPSAPPLVGYVTVDLSSVAGGVTVFSGSGGDQVGLSEADFGGPVLVNTGTGLAKVYLGTSAAGPTSQFHT